MILSGHNGSIKCSVHFAVCETCENFPIMLKHSQKCCTWSREEWRGQRSALGIKTLTKQTLHSVKSPDNPCSVILQLWFSSFQDIVIHKYTQVTSSLALPPLLPLFNSPFIYNSYIKIWIFNPFQVFLINLENCFSSLLSFARLILFDPFLCKFFS